MSVEAMPSPVSELPKSKKREKASSKKEKTEGKKEKKRGEESGVFSTASIDEQMGDVVAAARESSKDARHSRPDIHASQRARSSEVEREQEARGEAEVISLREKREAWQAELDVLEKRKILSDDERKRIVFLRSHIESASLIEQRAAEAAKRREAEEHADEVDRDLKAERKRLEEKERERKRLEEERDKADAEIAKEKDRLDALKRELKAHPDDPKAKEKEDEARTIAQRITEGEAELKNKIFLTRDARVEEKAARASMKGKADALEALTAAIALSVNKIAEFDEKIERVESEEELEAEPSSVAEREEETDLKRKAKEEKKTVRPGGSPLKTAGALFGVAAGTSIAIKSGLFAAIGKFSHVIIGGGIFVAGSRFFKTFFRNIYRLSMDPGKFFNELSSKYASAMEEPPKGKGAIRGFLSGTKWLLIGDPPPKKEITNSK